MKQHHVLIIAFCMCGLLTATTSHAATVIFDSDVDGFAAANVTVLQGNAHLGTVGEILGASGIAGSDAEQAFQDAVGTGAVDPGASAIILFTDQINIGVKVKATFSHPPVVIPGAVRIQTRKKAVFKNVPGGRGLVAWRRNINKILNDPALSPEQKKRALAALKAKKPAKYDKLIDGTGFEIIEEDIIIILPPIVVPQQWMLEFEFSASAFEGMGEAIDGLTVTDLFPGDVPSGSLDVNSLSSTFPDADIYDFGTDNGDPAFPPDTLNFTMTDVNAIPTVSEWGLIALALIFMVGGSVVFGREALIHQRSVGVVNSAIVAGLVFPLDGKIFVPIAAVVMSLTSIALLVGVPVLSDGDAIVNAYGSGVSAVLLAYLIHLWIVLTRCD